MIEETFAIDTNELAMKCISQVLEDSIDPKEKADFYTNEIERIFGDIVNKDVTQASLRLANDQLNSVGSYNYETGRLESK